ncbi:MAG TPA: hypothetical protein VI968_01200 [archaeon]|nr:hypothetical protein [archaeon]
MKIYIAGNMLVKEDSIPLKLMGKLQEVFPEKKFIELEPSDNMPEEKSLIIIDTIEGIKDVMVLENTDNIETGKIYSLHDFDLGFNLKLMKKTGKLESVKIIGVPQNIDEKEALKQISDVINSI